MKKWGLRSTSACECGVPEQTVDHIINDCPHFRPPNREQGLILGEHVVVSLWQSCGGGGLLSSLSCGIVPVQRLLVVGLAV